MESCGEINATQVYPIKIVNQISCTPSVTTPGGLLGLVPGKVLLKVNLWSFQKTCTSLGAVRVYENESVRHCLCLGS